MVQLGLLRSTLVYFSPLWSHSVHFGLLQSTVVPFSPIWSTGEIVFSPDALFRPRAYKNRASEQKKNFPSGSRVLESRDIMVDFFFPQMLCLGREPTKTEHLGTKKFPQWTQMLCLGRELTKTEHLGKKKICPVDLES